ncbi:hypothetical protein MD588_04595 [Photobacterium sp. SDRW27]|uniref:hypothetical protein n=1 Tax=Photobacterium obscurum TaxID=2829490 RepID=UPI0022448B8E|nr:hypothetical protein [Photobacterium obscurum]MCW8328080.1 hypothetical protein [Photobacterium obscurum]
MPWRWVKGLPCLLMAFQVYAQVYPSTGTAWVLPGWWDEPLATSHFDSAADVKEWEFHHADIVFGSMLDAGINRQTVAVGYIYTQKLDCRPGKQTAWLSKQAHQAGVDIEDGFLHFAEDTRLAVDKPSTGLDYLLKGKPYHLLLVRNGQFSTARLPLTLQPDDEIILFSSYPFDALQLQASVTPQIKLNMTNAQGNISGWRKAEVNWEPALSGVFQEQSAEVEPKLKSLTGQLLLAKPWISAFPQYQGRTLNSGEKGLAGGLKTWMLKLQWPNETRLKALKIRPWLELDNQQLEFPGWEAANDVNGDGYVSPSEFAQRKNTDASARFRHQARLIPAGHMWPGTCWYRINFANEPFNNLRASWYREDWQRQGLSGAYNDDMAKLLGRNQFTVISGGKISELPLQAGTEEAASEYALQLARFLLQVKQTTHTHWLAANISELNLWHYSVWPPQLREVIDLWLREHYLSPAMGLQRMQRSWDSFALAKTGDKSLIMATVKGGRSELSPSSAQAWLRDIETGLALYYFFNLPGYTYFHSWNQSYIYDSGNTTLRNWYRQGVPKNWVYQPSAMLEVDIGRPLAVPKGYKVVKWENKGDKVKSTSSAISGIPIRPANWFWLYRTGWFGDLPSEGVMARLYSEGLVLYRAVKERNNKGFLLAKPLRVSLPGEYQRVNYDGSLGEPIRYIELGGYEGAVLKRVPGT